MLARTLLLLILNWPPPEVKALKDLYPSVLTTIGNGLFSNAAKTYLQTHPPTSSAMVELGQDFPAFLRDYEHTYKLGYLPDLATLDLYRHQSYHAQDAEPLSAEVFTALDIQDIAATRIRAIPSARLLASSYAVFSIWNLAQNAQPTTSVQADLAEYCLILRPQMDVVMYNLDQGTYEFLVALLGNKSVSEALETAMSTSPDINPSEAFSFLIQCGLVADLIRGNSV